MPEPLRRSRRVAKLPPEGNFQACASVCRQLGLDSNPSDEAIDKYHKFWSKPLIRNHVKVMASMIGKELPDNTELQMAGSITVV